MQGYRSVLLGCIPEGPSFAEEAVSTDEQVDLIRYTAKPNHRI